MALLGYLASFAMGIILGLMGGGGSILTVPIMVYLFGLAPLTATGSSLLVVGLTALVGSFIYIRKGEIDFGTGLFFVIPSIVGVNLSRGLILPSIPDHIASIQNFILTKEILIMVTFALLMISASYSMIKKKTQSQKIATTASVRFASISFLGLIVGMIAGFVGAGGGFLIIPALVLVAGLSMRVAVGTSLLIIALQSLFGFAGDVFRGLNFEWSLLSIVAIISIVGILVGSTFAHKIKEQKLKTAFGWFVLFMGLLILSEQIHRLSA